ncbi:MAG: glycosyltransferase family 39 protein [Lentisphaeria bacterium]|nr:glycosyltransferase family 39 protein [Lentisphaeria bacterium]
MTECNKTHDKLMFYLTIILLAAGLLLRIKSFAYGSLEYDEIWTLIHYVPGPWLNIFTDLATPNNHPLHTLLAKISLGIFGESTATLRLPALLAGCGLIPLLWYTARKMAPNNGWAELIAIFWGSFHGYSLYYSQAARGYSLQMFFVLATFLCMWLLYKNPKSKAMALLLTGSAVCCCLSITSGLIYVCAIAGAFTLCFLLQKEENKVRLFQKQYILFPIAGICFILFAALWYGLNFKTIQQGQQFGTTLNSFLEFCTFVHHTFKDIFLYPLFAVCIAGTCFKNQHWRFAVFSLVFIGLILLSAFVTKAGPPRVYLGLYPILTVTAALTFSALVDEYCKKPQIQIILYLLCILPPALTYQKEWTRVTPPDWGTISSQLRKEIPSDILIAYTPPDTFPVRFNDQNAVKDYQLRIQQDNISGILSVNSSELTGYNKSTERTECIGAKLLTPVQKQISGSTVPVYFFPLEPVTENSKTYRQPLLLVIWNVPKNEFKTIFNASVNKKDANWILLNLWFIEYKDVINHVYGLDEAQYDAEHYLEITRRSGGLFRFYLFKK